jgi:hypothetical protein
MSIRSGYMGLADIGGTKVRCNSFGINPNQDVLFYDHVIGLKDTVPTDNSTKREDLGLTYANVQRKIWRPSPISITGGISFPATEKNLSDIFDLARYANYFDTNITYYCHPSENNSRTFTGCRINSFDFNIVAGDIVNVSLDIACKNVKNNNKSVNYTRAEKLITWDKVPLEISNAPFSTSNIVVQGFNFKINNNLQTIYTTTDETNTDESLLPTDIRVGMQEVTGTLTLYVNRGYNFIPVSLNNVANIRVNMVTTIGVNLNMTVVFKPSQYEGNIGPILVQLPFVCVDYYFA